MPVRSSLLAILEQGDCYGYQLRAEYSRRTGAAPLNVGQIYTTLERLERDGLVENLGADEHGHVYWGITPAGSDAAAGWLAAPLARTGRDEVAHKIALSATLPGIDIQAVVRAQLAFANDTLAESRVALAAAEATADIIVALAAVRRAEADVAWLEDLRGVVADAASFPLATERPRRGRPVAAARG